MERLRRQRKPVSHALAAAACAAALAVFASFAWARDRGADGNFDKRTSAHFLLLQDVALDEAGGFNGSRRFEEEVLGELERAYSAVESQLGMRPGRRLEVVIDDPGIFDQQFAAAFRFQAAGFYAGVIRVRGDTRLTAPLSRTLHHELVHAAFDAVAPSLVLPSWLNEGTAVWFEYRSIGLRGMPDRGHQILSQQAARNALLPLQIMSLPSFARLDNDTAGIAYLQSYGMVDYLVRLAGERSLPRFLEELLRSRDLNRALTRVYRLDLPELERRFLAELS
jgi:hypothetical protein